MALRLDATSSQYLAITSGALDNSGSFTVCGWFRRLSGTNRHVFNIMGGTRDWQHMDVVFVDSSGNWKIEAIVSYNVYSATGGACAVDTDYFVALVRSGSASLKLYVDGALECEVTDDVGGRPSSTWMHLGAYYDGGASAFSDARFSGWKAWSRALSQEELDGEALSKRPKSHDSLYAYWPFAPGASRPLDYSGNNNSWTENASPTDEADPPVAWGAPIVATGQQASVTNYTLTADSGSFSMSGTAATLRVARKVAAASGSFSLSGTNASLRVARNIDAASGSLALTGTAAGLAFGRKLAAGSGSLALSGNDASLRVARKISAESGAFTLTGQDVLLSYGAGYTMVAESGSFALSGTDVTLRRGLKLSASSGSFALSGASVALSRGLKLSAASRSFVLGDVEAALRVSRKMVAASGAFTLTGSDASLIYSGADGYTMLAESGSFALTMQPARLIVGTHWMRRLLESVRDTVADALPSTPIIHDGAPVPTLAASWARVTVTIDNMSPATIGGQDHYRAIGTVTVNVFVPRARGDSVAIAAAGDVCDALRLTRTADPFVMFRAPSIVGGVEFSDAWAMRTVRAAFSAEGDGMKAAS